MWLSKSLSEIPLWLYAAIGLISLSLIFTAIKVVTERRRESLELAKLDFEPRCSFPLCPNANLNPAFACKHCE